MQLFPRLIKAVPLVDELENLWMRKNLAVVSQQSSCEYANEMILYFSHVGKMLQLNLGYLQSSLVDNTTT
jgi:ABC-type protease/lipase transport system fused ATPase/permease subunit